jgi:hypothetical protein
VDPALRTPLVDLFKRGEVPRDVRLMAAEGAFAPRLHEQIALLVLLSADADPEVSGTAEMTLTRLPPAALRAWLGKGEATEEVRAFFAARGIHPAGPSGDGGSAPTDAAGLGVAGLTVGAAREWPESHPEPDASAPAEADEAAEPERLGTAQRLSLLSVAERMKVAMQGSREERSVLVRDPNRLVSAAVLSSPKLTESEVESIARMGNVSDEVLRIVGTSRVWTKNYNIVVALVRNAKTPIAVSLTLLSRLVERDVKGLATDRNIPEPVRVAARKAMQRGDLRRR